jgi:hypothetical protein
VWHLVDALVKKGRTLSSSQSKHCHLPASRAQNALAIAHPVSLYPTVRHSVPSRDIGYEALLDDDRKISQNQQLTCGNGSRCHLSIFQVSNCSMGILVRVLVDMLDAQCSASDRDEKLNKRTGQYSHDTTPRSVLMRSYTVHVSTLSYRACQDFAALTLAGRSATDGISDTNAVYANLVNCFLLAIVP